MDRKSRPDQASGVEKAGPWPWVTLRSYIYQDSEYLWRARQSRKGLNPGERGLESVRPVFWQSQAYNWLTGLIFSVGASLFMLGSMFSLMPSEWSITPSAFVTSIVFFMGSIPFTTAAYMQHFQAANTPTFMVAPQSAGSPRRISLIGWHPDSLGWLSTFTQFIGTIAFNFNTFDGIYPAAEWYVRDLTIWTPGMIGSSLFLISGYLAFIEVCHSYWKWKPKDLDWQITFSNLLGCIFFMTAGVLGYVTKTREAAWIGDVTYIHLWLGGLGFLIGALLLMRESALSASHKQEKTAGSDAGKGV